MSVLEDENIENDVNQLSTRHVPKRKKPTRKPVAATLRMSKVTSRALAYVATQVGSIALFDNILIICHSLLLPSVTWRAGA